MFKDVWFKFYSIPVLFAVSFFTLSFVLVNTGTKPVFSDAVVHCKDVSNDRWADDERTYQDKCIDEFYGGKEDGIITIFDTLLVLGLLFSVIGIVFIIPLSVYLLLSWRMRRYGDY